MPLTPEQLALAASHTIEHYDAQAESFWQGTRDHDVRQNIDALLRWIEGEAPFEILDLGCGPGRDLVTFTQLGHRATGLDGTPSFCDMARLHSGCEVLQQSFLELTLPAERYDGIFANASLFHVPTQELPRVLRELQASLKPSGVLFSSNPRGRGEEGWSSGRYGAYHDLPRWQAFMTDAGFTELEHYYRPEGKPREEQRWLASVWRKQGASQG